MIFIVQNVTRYTNIEVNKEYEDADWAVKADDKDVSKNDTTCGEMKGQQSEIVK